MSQSTNNPSAQGVQPPELDESAVRAALDSHYLAWAAGDADAFVSGYTEGATVCLPGVFNAGRDAVRKYMADAFAGPLKGSRGIDDPISVRVDGDTAVVVSKAGMLMAGEQTLPPEREVLATWVLVRRDSRWLVTSYHNCPASR